MAEGQKQGCFSNSVGFPIYSSVDGSANKQTPSETVVFDAIEFVGLFVDVLGSEFLLGVVQNG